MRYGRFHLYMTSVKIYLFFEKFVFDTILSFQVALKRQQAAEDAIALHLASAENGTNYEYLPPGRIYGMQVTSPCSNPPDSPEIDTSDSPEQPNIPEDTKETKKEIVVSPASIEMLSKLFPNKKRAVLELVLKRCNHDLLKAIEHFNLNAKSQNDTSEVTSSDSSHSSAFKPVGNSLRKSLTTPHSSSIPILASSKIFMHNFYPFLPLFNPQPVLQNPAVYVPSLCECDQCKHGLYARLERP